MKRLLTLVLGLLYGSIVFSECSLEDIDTLPVFDKNSVGVYLIKKDLLPFIRSTQGSTGSFYFSKSNEKLEYMEIRIYEERSRSLMKFYTQNSIVTFVSVTDEYYNHSIYEDNLKIVARTTREFPICRGKDEGRILYGIEEREYRRALSTLEDAISFIKGGK